MAQSIKISVNFGDEPEITIPVCVNTLMEHITIPKTVKKIIFNDEFNHVLKPGVLPEGITDIRFGSSFNQILEEGVIPTSVTSLTFGVSYNKSIKKDILPKNLKNLFFRSQYYSHEINDDVIPDSIEFFEFYVNSMTKNIPSKATELVFYYHDKKKILNIPHTVNKIYINNTIINEICDTINAHRNLEVIYRIFCKKNENKPKDEQGKYYIMDMESSLKIHDYYNITFENHNKIKKIIKLKAQINMLKDELESKKNIEIEMEKMRDELLKNKDAYEKSQKIINLFKKCKDSSTTIL